MELIDSASGWSKAFPWHRTRALMACFFIAGCALTPPGGLAQQSELREYDVPQETLTSTVIHQLSTDQIEASMETNGIIAASLSYPGPMRGMWPARRQWQEECAMDINVKQGEAGKSILSLKYIARTRRGSGYDWEDSLDASVCRDRALRFLRSVDQSITGVGV